MNSSYSFRSIPVYSHHVKKNICATRAKYRDSRKDTAVKVYTVNQESVYLIINDVPAVGAAEELRALCDQYGVVSDFRPLDEYSTEDFMEAYLVKYDGFPSARIAKKHLDDKSFFGSTLHVFYAPEFETVMETRMKLQERRKFVAWKTNSGKKIQTESHCSSPSLSSKTQKNCAIAANNPVVGQEPLSYIWAGKEYFVTPPPAVKTVSEAQKKPNSVFVPRQCKSSCESNSSSATISSNQPSWLEPNASTSVNTSDLSYQNTISQVRTKISNVSVPNVRVSLKRKKRL